MRALAAVASQLRGEAKIAVVEEALTAARAAVEQDRAQVLPDLAPQLGGEQLDEMLAVARAFWYQGDRAQALTALAPRLRGEAKIEVVGEALAAAGTIEDEEDRAEALAALAPHVSGGQLDEVLAAARVIEDEEGRLDVLLALPPHMDHKIVAREIRRCLLECLDARLAVGSRATLLRRSSGGTLFAHRSWVPKLLPRLPGTSSTSVTGGAGSNFVCACVGGPPSVPGCRGLRDDRVLPVACVTFAGPARSRAP